MDKTEARYGEIARLMSETGNWITPQIDYGLPFWAKPPLSTWASALSISFWFMPNFLFDFHILLFWFYGYFYWKIRKEMIQSVYFPGIIFYNPGVLSSCWSSLHGYFFVF